ncbi:flavodoxin family protein [Cognatishimia maritima]|uniref:Multimeric flavodoxin WrbA n=1 Tax=Cognatishimia maritima TaxID=870908 RepID=A0A1M5VK22_9RHOB|nr:flavodoxin family protein [Cognatishimia maritima]SHH75555.1 Multimeric flavodoxin WrbA [Cognatishimia maritima]
MARIEIVYFSGYGHTTNQANAVFEGASEAGDARLTVIPEDGAINEVTWSALDAADAIIFGSPTYMGGPAWQFKRFADESSERWMAQSWKNKFAAGFTNSASPVGDKGETINYFRTLAGQQGMLWVPLGQMPSNAMTHGPTDRNWLGGSGGALAQSPSDTSAEQAPHAGDLASAREYGRRVAVIAETKIAA